MFDDLFIEKSKNEIDLLYTVTQEEINDILIMYCEMNGCFFPPDRNLLIKEIANAIIRVKKYNKY